MSLTREDAHRLVDALDAVDVGTAVALLQQLAEGVPQRSFQGFDSFDGEPDLSERSAGILRRELGGGPVEEPTTRKRA